VRQVRIKRWDAELGAHVLRCVGFRAGCRDGYRGPTRKLRASAFADLRWHREDCHGGDLDAADG
jgi:hypothetical protein